MSSPSARTLPQTQPKLCTASVDNVIFHMSRLAAVDAITLAVETFRESPPSAATAIKDVIALIKRGPVQTPAIQALLTDLSGQVTEAVSKGEWFNKWGIHYLPAVASAHLFQMCTNFKDPGMQGYGAGPLFSRLRDEADAIFMGMEPPKPSNASRYGVSSAPMSTANFSRSYYNSSNSCFHGASLVAMGDGTTKRVDLVKKGDVVSTGGWGQGATATTATVYCVVKTLTEGGKCSLVQLPSGLSLTPYHPILVAGVWTFPKDVQPADEGVDCPAVYSFALDATHTTVINGVICICLGHGIEDDKVASHPYFGTRAIIDDLMSVFEGGWNAGLVVFNFGNMKREEVNDTETLIVGFEEARYLPELSVA